MNLAYRDIKHRPLRFVLTCAALSVLLGIVITMTGIYQGFVDDALRQSRAANPDLWVVEAGTNGPFAAASRISGDSREMIARVYGIARAGSVTYQSVQTQVRCVPLRLFLTGFEPGRPGGPRKLFAGRQIMRGHYEIIVDRSTGLSLGQEVSLGTRGHKFTVVGLTRDEITGAGDAVAYVTLLDAQNLQFELAPPIERREAARGGPRASSDIVNAVVATVSPFVPVAEVVATIGRWKHLSALTQAQQEALTMFVIEKNKQQIKMFTVLLVSVSGVILALIVYTLTMDKVRSIATLKLIGARDRTIVGLIVQQSLSMGIVGYFIGFALVLEFKDYFPRRVVLVPEIVSALFVVTIVVCLLASSLGVRLAVKTDPATALAG
jgi:putative ABC transport system permease protein